jgi:diguanylate cyclase (GGDEF)-like protein
MRFLHRIVGLCALTVACTAWTVSANAADPKRILTTARAAHDLSLPEAARAYPVRLHAVVTYYDPYIDSRHAALFVTDHTGSVFVGLPSQPILPLHPGTEVEVVGVSGTGDYAPVVAHATVRILGQSHLPTQATKASMAQLLSSSGDGQWVEIEGMVRSVHDQNMDVSLDIMTLSGPVTATSPRDSSADYGSLVDSLVRIHANAGPVFNRHKQMVGVHLFFPSRQVVQVLQPAPSNPYATPPKPISGLLAFEPGAALPHRTHVRGSVTLQWPGRLLCIQQASDGLCIQTPQTNLLRAGDVVDVLGFPAISDYKATLEDATFRTDSAGAAVSPKPFTVEEAFAGEHDQELVQMQGELIGQDLTAGDPELVLRAGKFLFAATLPREMSPQGKLPWKDGSILRITGVCNVKVNSTTTNEGEGVVRPDSVNLLLRSTDDVIILHSPSWWTPVHALAVISLVGITALAALAWVVVLRRRVEQQTQAMRLSEERLRHMSQHDALTGLPNRLLLNDRLSMAIKRVARFNSMLGLLMVDIDRFKEVNDSLGHQIGDQVLCEVGSRIHASVRCTDTVARLGGDEFIVLLPDLKQAVQAEMIAAKIVAAIQAPIDTGHGVVEVSVSVGVSTAPPDGGEAEKLLQCADDAMYHAKAAGKNGYYVHRSAPGQPEYAPAHH